MLRFFCAKIQYLNQNVAIWLSPVRCRLFAIGCSLSAVGYTLQTKTSPLHSLHSFALFTLFATLFMQISTQQALEQLSNAQQLFLEVFKHGTLSVEIYKPQQKDNQQPHKRDEVYVVIAGSGNFYANGKTSPFKAGDFLFVPAGIEHRFEDFTNDFSTWVIFYGPIGGEMP